MKIRKATLNDANELKEIFRTTVQKVNCKDYPEKHIQVWSEVADEFDWSTIFDTQKVWVVERNNEIAGFSSLKPDGLLNLMYVHYNHQGMGVATLLEKTILSEAKAQKNKTIWASVSKTARPFFKARGYEITRMDIREKSGVTFENAIMEKVT